MTKSPHEPAPHASNATNAPHATMRIGDLTKRAEVTPRTVRYYESIGLIPAGEREGNGQHYYSEETVLRLRKIDQLKALGLSLDEIRDVIDLYFIDPSGIRPKQKVLEMLREHLREVDEKTLLLKRFRADLQAHIDRFELWLESQTSTPKPATTNGKGNAKK